MSIVLKKKDVILDIKSLDYLWTLTLGETKSERKNELHLIADFCRLIYFAKYFQQSQILQFRESLLPPAPARAARVLRVKLAEDAGTMDRVVLTRLA